MKTSIIIPVWNKLDCTKQCLEFVDHFTPEEHEVVIIDNGSTDGTAEWLSAYTGKTPNRMVITNPKNMGFPVAVNQGVAMATGDYICLLNNDVVVSEGWLSGLIKCINSAPDIAIVGPRTNNISGPQQVSEVSLGYDSIEAYLKFAKNFSKSFRGMYQPYWRMVGFCMLFKRDLLHKIGDFDERFSPGNFEDDDFCLRACLAGYRNMMCGDVFVHHHGSQSHNPETFQKIIDKNQRKFEFKWSSRPKTISAVMIVKNEEKHIERCLNSIVAIVDEIIIVDTGSTDDTIAIAEKFPKVKVFKFEWCDDFGAARQFANDQATMAYCFSIDADEVVTGLDTWKSKLRPFYSYRICTRNYTNNIEFANLTFNKGDYKEEIGQGWFPSEKVRIWPNDKRVRWEYPVHEVVENSLAYLGMGTMIPSDLIIHHYGRMDDGYDAVHNQKYFDYLHKQWKSGMNDLRSLEQLATQAQGMQKWEDAIRFWKEVLKLEPTNADAPLNMCHCYVKLEKYLDAHNWALRRFILEPDSRDSRQNLAYTFHLIGDDGVAEVLVLRILKGEPNNPVAKEMLKLIKGEE